MRVEGDIASLSLSIAVCAPVFARARALRIVQGANPLLRYPTRRPNPNSRRLNSDLTVF
jgi:hypothetical protein